MLFLYRHVLDIDLPWLDDLVRARRPTRLPAALSRQEVASVLACAERGVPRLMLTLLHGSGLRLLECCQLRVKDLDFDRRQLVVIEGEGDKDRYTGCLPAATLEPLRAQLEAVHQQHERDVETGAGWVEVLPRPCPQVPERGLHARLALGLPGDAP